MTGMPDVHMEPPFNFGGLPDDLVDFDPASFAEGLVGAAREEAAPRAE